MPPSSSIDLDVIAFVMKSSLGGGGKMSSAHSSSTSMLSQNKRYAVSEDFGLLLACTNDVPHTTLGN
jgi:hypothetical protein